MKNLLIIFLITIFSFSTAAFAQQSEIDAVTKQIKALEKKQQENDVKIAALYKKKVELYEKREADLRQQELKVVNQNLDLLQRSLSSSDVRNVTSIDLDVTNPESAYQEILRMQKEEENQEYILCLKKEQAKKERVEYLLNIF